MSTPLPEIVDRFAQQSVLVIGECMLDRYLQGATSRLCPEAPVPIVEVAGKLDQPGGAANSALNARSLGANVAFLSVVGDDAEGRSLLRALRERGVETGHMLVERGRRTLTKQRVLAGCQLLVRFDQGDTSAVCPAVEAMLIARLEALWQRSEAVIVSDYGYGILTPGVIAHLTQLQAKNPRVLVVDSKRLPLYRQAKPTAIKPNYSQALALLETAGPPAMINRAEWMLARGPQILEATGARIASVTLDTEGALVFESERPPYRTFAKPEQPARAAGAGDTFGAALALALAAGADTPAAADLASIAAAVVVAKDGTATCTNAELHGRVSPAGKALANARELVECLDAHRRGGHRLVFTNGCFDILHRGHISYLSRAKALGDVLVIGVNTDASVRRLKGSSRPINNLDDRVQVLSALSCVDHVVPFDEDTPHELIRVVRPHVFVKGGDYTRETLPEASLVEQLGGSVEILPFTADRSTTDIITRIRQAYGAPDAERNGHACIGTDGAAAAIDSVFVKQNGWIDRPQLVNGGNGA